MGLTGGLMSYAQGNSAQQIMYDTGWNAGVGLATGGILGAARFGLSGGILLSDRFIKPIAFANGGGMDGVSAEQILALRTKHASILAELESTGFARLPMKPIQLADGSIGWTAAGWKQTMAELTVATGGREVGLGTAGGMWTGRTFIGGERMLILGNEQSIAWPQFIQRVVAHTHPSGTLAFSSV